MLTFILHRLLGALLVIFGVVSIVFLLIHMIPGDPVSCELKISRFGKNLVCNVRINGELFLYPAYVAANEHTVLTAVVGEESDGSNAMIGWTKAQVASNSESSPVAA